MKKLLTIILVFAFFKTNAQKGFLKIEDKTIGENYAFPIVSSNDKNVQEKINTYIKLSLYDVDFNDTNENDFSEYLRYEILSNTESIFSVAYYHATCGATCYYFNYYFNFNPKNGDRYFLRDFFSKENYIIFQSIVLAKRQDKFYDEFCNYVKNNPDDYDDELSDLTLDEVFSSIEKDDLVDFYVKDDSIFFDNFNLLRKSEKFLGINHVTTLSISDFKNLFNNFGLAVLVAGKNTENYKSISEPQLYKGKMDNQKEFYFLSDFDSSFLWGSFSFKNDRNSDFLSGEYEGIGKDILFSKEDEEGEIIIEMKIIKKEEDIEGYWMDMKDKQKIGFKAKRK